MKQTNTSRSRCTHQRGDAGLSECGVGWRTIVSSRVPVRFAPPRFLLHTRGWRTWWLCPRPQFTTQQNRYIAARFNRVITWFHPCFDVLDCSILRLDQIRTGLKSLLTTFALLPIGVDASVPFIDCFNLRVRWMGMIWWWLIQTHKRLRINAF